MPSTTDKTVILTEGNWDAWESYVEDTCLSSGQLAWKCLEGSGWGEPVVSTTSPTDFKRQEHLEWEKSQNAAKGIIRSSISEPNKRLIKGMTAFNAYAVLKAAHNLSTGDRQYQLLQTFASIHQSHKENLPEYLSHSQVARDHLLAALPSTATAADLLSTIVAFFSLQNLEDTKENQSLRDTLQRTTNISEATLETAYRKEQTSRTTNRIVTKQESAKRTKVIAAAAKEDNNNNNNNNNINNRKPRGSHPPCLHCTQTSHKAESCWSKFPEKKPEWVKMREEVQKKEREAKQRPRAPRTRVNDSDDEDVIESCKMASRTTLPDGTLGSADHNWNTDTGATSSMTPHLHWIRNLTLCRIPVHIANDEVVYAEGRGDVLFQPIVDGEKAPPVLFSRVLYVPALLHDDYAMSLNSRLRFSDSSSLGLGLVAHRL
ncbi:hypothetical protein FRB97_000919 [Tulasnella sp. 331]|nr:hypothetical protein FRB97_000919 [Tulasnella sp. 331]